MPTKSIETGEHPAITVPLIGGATRPPQHIEPEFVDCPGAYHLFGLRRSMLYELNARGVIRGVSLRTAQQRASAFGAAIQSGLICEPRWEVPMKPPNEKGALLHAPIPKLALRTAYSIAALLATMFGWPFWFFECRRGRLSDLIENERNTE